MQRNPEITGLGYCGLDYSGIVPKIPLDDKVEIIKSLVQGGGPAATATFTAARLGAATAFIGSIGADERGRLISHGLTAAGINTDSVVIRAQGESPAAFCWTEESSGRRSIMWTRGTVTSLTENEVDIDLIKNTGLLHLDGHQTNAALFAAELARSNGVTVSLDAGTILPGIEYLLELSDIIIASEKFAEEFTGETNKASAVRKLFAKNCKFSAITSGSDGSVGFDGKEIFNVPAFKVEVIDTTGAGDVFHGAFAYRYIHNGSWRECMRFASAAAALKCKKFGGRTGIPDLATVNNFLEHSF
ncbi:MAG: PfkB family carbohydrate kinase [Victivallaceae bacterium]|nr:PfkB family carbohydrate kinase [Victivallaceae bacterium]